MHYVVAILRYRRLRYGRLRYGRLGRHSAGQCPEDQCEFQYRDTGDASPIRYLRGPPSVLLRVIGDEPGKLEGAHQHCAVAAHRVRGLRAEATRFEAVGARSLERPLRERVHGAPRVAEGAENSVSALDDHGEIRPRFTQRPALAHTGDAEHEQQIAPTAGCPLKAEAHAGRLVSRFTLTTGAAVRPIDGRFDGTRHARAEIAVAGP